MVVNSNNSPPLSNRKSSTFTGVPVIRADNPQKELTASYYEHVKKKEEQKKSEARMEPVMNYGYVAPVSHL